MNGSMSTSIVTAPVPATQTNYRMQRLFPSDRAAIIVPIDHGLIFGRISGLEAPAKVMRRLAQSSVSGFMMSPGLVKRTQSELGALGNFSRVMAIDIFWPLLDATRGTGTLIATVEDAARLGVDCVKLLMPWNTDDIEKVQLCKRIGSVISAAAAYAMPVMVEPVMLGAPRTPDVVKAECEVARIAFELGSDIIKIAFPGAENTAALVDELDVPIVIAGGPLDGGPDLLLEQVRDVVSAGAAGLIVGRNVWQRSQSDGERIMQEMADIAHASFVRR
jgi:class I fructose-bisphosphate aldolase